MKAIFFKTKVFVAILCVCSLVSCSPNSTSNIKKRISGTWEVYSVTTYDIETLKVLDSEGLFDEDWKWDLVITENGEITKPAKSEYDKDETARYTLYTGNDALKKGIIEKKHQRRAASSDDDIILLFADKTIIGERLFQIVDCENDTLKLRFLTPDKILDDQLFEFKLVKKES
jgi:hypothetical protein